MILKTADIPKRLLIKVKRHILRAVSSLLYLIVTVHNQNNHYYNELQTQGFEICFTFCKHLWLNHIHWLI